jgi:hypothetical protein
MFNLPVLEDSVCYSSYVIMEYSMKITFIGLLALFFLCVITFTLLFIINCFCYLILDNKNIPTRCKTLLSVIFMFIIFSTLFFSILYFDNF